MKEFLLQDFRNKMIIDGVDNKIIEYTANILSSVIVDYNISKTETALVTYDYSNERLVELYIATIAIEGKRPKTAAQYGRFINKFAGFVNKSLCEVETNDIRNYILTRLRQVKKITVENERAYLSAFYTWLTSEKYIAYNPMSKIKPIKFESEVKHPLSKVEIDSLRSACRTVRDRAILEVLLSSGVRVSELCNLNITDIDFNTNEVRVIDGKGGKDRITYIDELAKAHLYKYLETRTDDDKALFMSRLNQRISKESVELLMRNLGRVTGIEKVHPHKCRRTFATTLSRNGTGIEVVQSLMGHTEIGTTQRYIALDKSYLRSQYKI